MEKWLHGCLNLIYKPFLSDLLIFRRFSVNLHLTSCHLLHNFHMCMWFFHDISLLLHHFYHVSCCTPSALFISALRFVWLVNCALTMAESDRSRSPAPSRNRLEPRGQAPPLPPELPFFPRWCGPMNASVRHFQNMSRPQNRPTWPMNQSGPYMMGRDECGHHHHSTHHKTGNLSSFHRLHPVPCHPPFHILHSHVQSLPLALLRCHAHQHSRALQAHLPFLHLNLVPTPLLIQTHRPGTETMRQPESMGSDLNPHWQEDQDHYDNQKVNGVTLPRSIRQLAFTQKLDIEGCDPLSLPVAALLYQQANNHWLRKLAHGRELYLIIRGISRLLYSPQKCSRSSGTEASTWTKSLTSELDRTGNYWTRQPTQNSLLNR